MLIFLWLIISEKTPNSLTLLAINWVNWDPKSIIKILNNDELRQKIAKTGRNKYFKFFNSTVIVDFIIAKTFNIKKKYFCENKN